MLGRRLGALYSPAVSVVTVRVRFLCVSTIVTVAPTTAPPVWSVTAPRIRPALPCEKSCCAENKSRLSDTSPIAVLDSDGQNRRAAQAKHFIMHTSRSINRKKKGKSPKAVTPTWPSGTSPLPQDALHLFFCLNA